jgi:hypothetical protein
LFSGSKNPPPTKAETVKPSTMIASNDEVGAFTFCESFSFRGPTGSAVIFTSIPKRFLISGILSRTPLSSPSAATRMLTV